MSAALSCACRRASAEDAVASPPRPVPEDAEPRTALWQRLSALRRQAEQNGELPEPMSWDEVLAETHRRRGDADE